MRKKIVLISILIFFNLIDYVQTVYGVGILGLRESNPFMNLFMHNYFLLFFVKMSVIGLGSFIIYKKFDKDKPSKFVSYFVVVIYFFVVVGNFWKLFF